MIGVGYKFAKILSISLSEQLNVALQCLHMHV